MSAAPGFPRLHGGVPRGRLLLRTGRLTATVSVISASRRHRARAAGGGAHLEAPLRETFTLSVQCRLAASHTLPGCPPCDRLHGHTWTVRVFWCYAGLDAQGMGKNFRELKALLRQEVEERYDHRHLNEIAPFDRIPATTENLAREIWRALAAAYDPEPRGRLARVEVWEGPESCVAYEAEPDGTDG